MSKDQPKPKGLTSSVLQHSNAHRNAEERSVTPLDQNAWHYVLT